MQHLWARKNKTELFLIHRKKTPRFTVMVAFAVGWG